MFIFIFFGGMLVMKLGFKKNVKNDRILNVLSTFKTL